MGIAEIAWLLACVVFPPLGRVLTARSFPVFSVPARLSRLFWLIGSVALWGQLALSVGRWRAGNGDGTGAGGTIVLVLLAGAVYLEVVSLLPLSRSSGHRAKGEEPVEGAAQAAADHSRPDAEAQPEEELSKEAEALLKRILRLDQIPCSAIMTPRDRIVSVEASQEAEEALGLMVEAGSSRLVVVAGSLDRILGIVHAKDLVPLALESGGGSFVRRHLRRALRVPAEKTVARLLEDFRRDRVHIGVVSDSMGATLGLVTLGDVFRYLAGFGEQRSSVMPLDEKVEPRG